MGILRVPFKTWIVSIAMGFISSCGRMISILSTDGETSIFAQQYQTSFGQRVSEIKSKGVIVSWKLLPQNPNETKRNFRKSSAGNNTNSLCQFHPSFQPHPLKVVPENRSNLIDSLILPVNGVLMNIGTVLWIDSFRAVGFVQSTATDLTWFWIILLAIGGIGFILAGLGVSGKLSKRQPKSSSPSTSFSPEQSPAPLPATNKYCPQCGTENPIQAGFCTKCGAQLPSQ